MLLTISLVVVLGLFSLPPVLPGRGSRTVIDGAVVTEAVLLSTSSVGPSQKTFALVSSPECILPRQPCPATDVLSFLLLGFEPEINKRSEHTCSEYY